MNKIKTNTSHGVTLEKLFQAYFDCRKNKRNTLNALTFEADYENNLITLCNELNSSYYLQGSSIAFVINKPVKREIFAADFRDRIVHHWLINELNPFFERAFIYDSYASRIGRGAHYGIQRTDRFIRQCSVNYTHDCFVLKLDIQSFFTGINKLILLTNLTDFIASHYTLPNQAIILELCEKIIMNDPVQNCQIRGQHGNWISFPKDKSLFYAKANCGLPIGNLTSQVFANFYLNSFDHFIKHDLGMRYYGRYVDDFILIHENHNYLKSLIPQIRDFLKNNLDLTLHPKKIHLQHYNKGVNFLGVVIKPHRILMGKRIKGNFYNAITTQNKKTKNKKPNREEQAAFLCSMNSYLGIMKHYHTKRLRKSMLKKHLSIWWWNLVYLSCGNKLTLKQKTIR